MPDVRGLSRIIEEDCDYGLGGYIRELVRWCRKQIERAERYPEIVRLTEHANQELRIPWGRLDLLSKYQVSLDNQFYKAMKALRDAQEWRLSSANTLCASENFDRLPQN